MSEKNETKNIIEDENPNKENLFLENDILNFDFLKSFETPQKLPEKKAKITKLINFFLKNPTYLQSLKETQNLNLLYNIILTNLIENNNKFIISQINLIKILSEQISSLEDEEIKFNFGEFFKKALPKLFDKFYLQNENINNNLLEIFIFILEKNILKFNDYFPFIENICIEEDEDYKINILNFISKVLNIDEKIYKKNIPENIYNAIEKLSENKDNENLQEIADNIIKIFNEREKDINNKDINEFEIPNTPLSQQDSKLAFSSFIKKISKAVRKENMNKNKSYNIITEKDKMENNTDKVEINNELNIKDNKLDNNEDKNIITENGQINQKNDIMETEVKNELDNKEFLEEKNFINNNDLEQNENNIKINIEENNNDILVEHKDQEIIEKNNNIINDDIQIEEQKEVNQIPKKIITDIENDNRNIFDDKLDIKNDDNIPKNCEQKEEPKNNKVISKENKNKKIVKNRITRSRKLGILAKPKINKEKEKEKEIDNEIDNNNDKIIDQKNSDIIVNKIEQNKKESIDLINEENKSHSKEIEQNINFKKNLSEDLLSDEIIEKNNINKENQEDEFKLKDNNENNIKDGFDEIPIIINNNEIKNDLNIEEENGIKLPKNISIEDFNKKIDSALEQDNQDNLIKQNSESNLNEKEEKDKDKDKEIDDPKYNEIKSILGSEICDLFSSQKWENKKHALEQINILINENDIIFNSNDLYNYIKYKMKNFKETNFNLIREALNIFVSLLKKRNLSKDNFLLLINTYYEKITDVKLKDNFIELINIALEESIIDPGSIIYTLISKISKKKNVKLLTEYSMLFSKLIEENDIKDLPVNDIIKFCKLMAGNSNPQVRTSATNLICILYKYMGEDLKPLIKDIKESTLKLIEAELEKITIIEKKENDKKKSSKKIIKRNSKNEKILKKMNGENIQESTQNLLTSDPQDVSKKINAHLKNLSEGKWPEKKEAFENIENILSETNNKILPTGLNDIFLLIKSKLSDGNKNYVKMIISLLTKLISALKKDFKSWSKMIALSLIPILSDKNQSIINECQLCFEAWINFVGIDSLVIHFPQFLKNDNVESRIEIMKFIKKYNNKFSKNLGENIFKELIDSLLICLQDRSINVRNEAENIIMLSLDYVNIDNYYKKIKDFKPAIEKDLKLILDNINERRVNHLINNENDNPNEENDNLDYNNENYNLKNYNSYNSENNIQNDKNKLNNKIIKKNSNDNKEYSPDKKFNIKEKMRNSLKMKKSANLDKSNNINLSDFMLNNEEKINYNNDYMSRDEEQELTINNKKNKNNALNSSEIKRRRNMIKTAEKEKYKKANSKLIEKKENTNINSDEKEGGTLASNSTVLRRHKNMNSSLEKRVKINRKNTSNKTNNNKVISQIFNLNNNLRIPINKNKRLELDKKFKFSIDTISRDDIMKLKEFAKIIFVEDINTKIFENDLNREIDFFKRIKNYLDTKDNFDIFFDNMDIILKIISLKVNNNYNPSLLKNFLNLFESIYMVINKTGYQINETEANIILCLLIDKISINNYQLKENALNLIKEFIDIIDINETFLDVLNYSLNKNSKVILQVLDMTLQYHLDKKINMTSKAYIKILSKYLSLNDEMIKNKCLKIFKELQEHIKEEYIEYKDIDKKGKNFLKSNSNNFEYEDENNVDDEEEENNGERENDDANENDIKQNDDDNDNNSEKIDNQEEEIYNSNKYDFNIYSDKICNFNNKKEEKYYENNINKYYLSEDRYQNPNQYNNNFNNDNQEFITNEVKEDNEDNEENDILLDKPEVKFNKSCQNYYIKTDNKLEDKQNKNNLIKQPVYYKNTEMMPKIQKIKSIKKDSINNNSSIKQKTTSNKFSLPKKKPKMNNNINKKYKVFNNKLNKSQNIKQKIKIDSGKKNNNIKNNNKNKDIINSYYNDNDNVENIDNNNNNNSNGNSIDHNENNGSNNNNNNDISISLYNDYNINISKGNNDYQKSSIFSEKDLLEIMNNLFSEDESAKMGTIILIHEILCSKYQQNKYILIPNIDNIIKIIIQITHELFEYIDTLNNSINSLKFAKYLTTILCKITSNKELIIHISYKVLYDLCYELLNYLLINDLDKIGSNQEGNIIFKSLNSAMLRVLENCDTTSVILALLEIVKQNQNNNNSGLLCNLAMKCLFKATQNINEIINKIQLDKILLQMHILTYNFDKLSNGKETNSQSSIMIIKFIKNFVIDIVKIKKGDIMEDYNKSIANNQYKDKYIYNWILNTLEFLEYSDKKDNEENNELSKSTNIRSSSINMNKNKIINNTDKKKENGGLIFEGNKIIGNNNTSNNLTKKSVIIVKKHANNSINNRYNINNNSNYQTSVNNITATKSSILGTSNISNNNRINVQKSLNSKNSQIYNKGNIKSKKKTKFNK